jgi:hypothetical protein
MGCCPSLFAAAGKTSHEVQYRNLATSKPAPVQLEPVVVLGIESDSDVPLFPEVPDDLSDDDDDDAIPPLKSVPV